MEFCRETNVGMMKCRLFFSSCNNGDDQSCCFGLGKVQLQYVSIGSKSDHHDKSLGVMEVLIIMVLTLNSCFFFW